MMSYRADKVKFTDRQTDGRTDGHKQKTTIPLRPERPRGKKLLNRYDAGFDQHRTVPRAYRLPCHRESHDTFRVMHKPMCVYK